MSDLPQANTVVPFLPWIESIKHLLKPPVGNKLMFGAGQLKVMIVGGPNTRKDFHTEEGEEFFYQLKGDMRLDVMERGQKKGIHIREGHCFVLPPRVPHSPQRFENTIGLVIERDRQEGEMDGLRWYVDDTNQVLFEDWFHCTDLGTQLKPVIEAFFASEEYHTGKPTRTFGPPPVKIDEERTLPEPLDLAGWMAAHRAAPPAVPAPAQPKAGFVLAGDEFRVDVSAGAGEWTHPRSHGGEVWVYQAEGDAVIAVGDGPEQRFPKGSCILVQRGTAYSIAREDAGSVTLTVTMVPQPPSGAAEAGAA